MTIARKTFSCLAVLLTSVSIGTAQPSGDIGFLFDATDAPVWDFTGFYGLEQTTVAVQHDTRGRLHGSGATFVQVGNDVAAASYNVSGSVSGSGNDTRAKFTVRLRGRDWLIGAFRSFNITLKYDLSVVAEDLMLVGTVKGSASYSGLGSETIREEVEFPLPAGADGSWAVVMNIVPLQNKLVGTGAFLVSTFRSPDLPIGWPEDRVLPAEVRGNYKPQTDTADVKVKGINEGRGTNVKIRFHDDDLFPFYVNGKVLGQRVRIE